jgi:hypothetical protein
MLLLTAAIPCSGHQPSTASSDSSSVGLLLGYVSHQRDLEGTDIPSVVEYRTLLIVGNASGVRVVATLPDVIVPRKSGFWRVGIERTCQSMPPVTGDPLLNRGAIEIQDIAYAAPVEKAPIVELEPPACDLDTTKRVLDGSPNPSSYEQCGGLDLWFRSVLPDLISVSANEVDLCARGGHSYQEIWVQRPDDPMPPFFETWHADSIPSDAKIRFDQLFGPAAHDAWVRAVSPVRDNAEETCNDDDPNVMQETGWNLEHVEGVWRTTAYVNVDGFCEGLGHPEIVVPRSLTHTVRLPVPWSALERELPGISDAYFSPDVSVVLAVQSAPGPGSNESHVTSVGLFDFSGGKVGRKLVDLPAGDVIMAEWATGRFVKGWIDSLATLQANGLPAPVLKLKAQPK